MGFFEEKIDHRSVGRCPILVNNPASIGTVKSVGPVSRAFLAKSRSLLSIKTTATADPPPPPSPKHSKYADH